MFRLVRYLRADFLKLKRQPQLLMHIIIPAIGVIIFLAYYSYAPWTPISKAVGYLEAVAVSFPALIGIVCSMAAEQEAASGNFQNMLTSPIKLLPFLSMLLYMLILGCGSVIFAVAGFGIAFISLLKLMTFSLAFFFYAAGILLISNVFLYVLHLLVSLRFGKGASIGLGFVESLLSALFITGLGEGRWQFVPCTWGVRFASNFAQRVYGLTEPLNSIPEVHTGIIVCIAETIALILFSCVWFCRWEGRRSEE